MNISVIIPVYNAESFLEKAVESALQLREVKEILLIEDKSPDRSLEICRDLEQKDPRVKLFQHPDKKNHGAGASRNLGLKKATQEFIAFLDADDYYLPNRFEQDEVLFRNPKIDGVFNAVGTAFLSSKGEEEFKNKFGNITLTTVKRHAEGKDVFYGLLGMKSDFGTFFHLNGLTVRKSAIERIGLEFNPDLKVHQDSDFIIKLAYHCYLKSGDITEPVAMRGVHDDNRITKIPQYSQEYNKKQAMLWKSLYTWSKSIDENKLYLDYIRRNYTSYALSQKKGLDKLFSVMKAIISDPELIKTRYRFTYLRK